MALARVEVGGSFIQNDDGSVAWTSDGEFSQLSNQYYDACECVLPAVFVVFPVAGYGTRT